MDQQHTPKKVPAYQTRLDARKAKMESEAREHQMRLQNNISYASKNLPAIAKNEIVTKIAAKNPQAGKLLGLVGLAPKETTERRLSAQRVSGRFKDDTGRFDPDARIRPQSAKSNDVNRWIDLLEEWGLPILATFGSQKLLSLALGGSGKLIRSGVASGFKLLFRRKDKRR